MRSPAVRQARRAEIRHRLAAGAGAADRCLVIGCPHPPTAATGKGLNRRYCRRHEEHFARHGSYIKASYSASVTAPARRAAFDWLTANEASPDVKRFLSAILRVYQSAGRATPTFRLAGQSPSVRARAVWARLREAGVDPRLPAAAWLGVASVTRADPMPERSVEYRGVQVAKIIHRMASGSHRRWVSQQPSGAIQVTEMHKYSASRGEILRRIGAEIERCAETLSSAALGRATDEVLGGLYPSRSRRPHPRSAGRRRSCVDRG